MSLPRNYSEALLTRGFLRPTVEGSCEVSGKKETVLGL